MNKILIPEGQIHSGNEVNERSYYQIPIGSKFYPWHQGRKTVEFDNYAEFIDKKKILILPKKYLNKNLFK